MKAWETQMAMAFVREVTEILADFHDKEISAETALQLIVRVYDDKIRSEAE